MSPRPVCPTCNGTLVRQSTGGPVPCTNCDGGRMRGVTDLTEDEKRILDLEEHLRRTSALLSAAHARSEESRVKLEKLIGYLTEAQNACGDDRFTGQPLADAISVIREERSAALASVERMGAELAERNARLAYLEGLLNTPETKDFLAGVEREAAHQRARWGTEHDAGKTDADWYWIIGHLVGKALHKPEKRLHHLITAAAALFNWHLYTIGRTNMRPGIAPELASNLNGGPDGGAGSALKSAAGECIARDSALVGSTPTHPTIPVVCDGCGRPRGETDRTGGTAVTPGVGDVHWVGGAIDPRRKCGTFRAACPHGHLSGACSMCAAEVAT